MKIFNKQKNNKGSRFINSYSNCLKRNPEYSRGFTLIEIMVATSIFISVMLIAMGSLIIASNSAKQSQALQSAMDNVNFAVDNISRSLRMGTNYSCVTVSSLILPLAGTNDCALNTTGGGGIGFVPAGDASLVPDMAYITKQRADLTWALQRCDATNTCVDLVSNNVDVKTLKFFVTGSSKVDTIQPSVYIIMKGVIKVKSQSVSFAIQTIASQRTTEQ